MVRKLLDKIDIKFPELAYERPRETIELFVELYTDVLRYRGQYYSEERKSKEDESLGWEDMYHDFDIFVKRNAFVGIDKRFICKSDLWGVYAEGKGYTEVLQWFFIKEKDAIVLFEKLKKWVYDY